MRLLLILVVATLLWPACGKPPSGRRPAADDVALPLRLAATPSPAPVSGDALTVTLTAKGRIVVAKETLTLDQLSTLIKKRAQERTRHGPTGLKVARLVCRLRIDRTACWRHVQWLLILLAEQRVMRVHFVVLDAGGREVGLAWDLPWDLPGIREPPPLRILVVNATLTADGSIRCGGFASSDPRAFADYLEKARALVVAEELDGLAGEIGGKGQAPWGACIAVFELLLAAGAEHIDFSASEIPLKAEREVDPLPVSPAGDRRVGVGGTAVREAWRDDGRLTFDLPEEDIVEEPVLDDDDG